MAEEKKRKARAERLAAAADADNLVDEVFGKLRDTPTDDILSSLKGSSGLGRRKKPSNPTRNRPARRLTGTLIEEDTDVDANNGIQAMMSMLGIDHGSSDSGVHHSSSRNINSQDSQKSLHAGNSNVVRNESRQGEITPDLLLSLASEMSSGDSKRDLRTMTPKTPSYTGSKSSTSQNMEAINHRRNILQGNSTPSKDIDDQSELAAFLKKKRDSTSTSKTTSTSKRRL
jgi:hypothetical protein